uniref:Nucleolar protein 10 n=1 Tax=Ascaris lumbricoides TaxID=6252 RepID=A0A0M3HV87_ASCLU
MYLKFYLDEQGNRVYTLKELDPEGRQTQSAHPARFSPEDKRLFISFILFFIGWKIIGITLSESLFYKRDETTGEMRLFSPAEMKQRLLVKMEAPPELPPSVSKPFPLDD